MEEMMLGDFNNSGMTISQMLYILDIKNYKKNLDTFREEYKLYKEKQSYLIDESLKNFLLLMKI